MTNFAWADFVVAVGMALFLEGMLYAIFPQKTQEMMRVLMEQNPSTFRFIGFSLAVVGALLIASIRGL